MQKTKELLSQILYFPDIYLFEISVSIVKIKVIQQKEMVIFKS